MGTGMDSKNSFVENALERTLFASRWLMAPFYLGLSASLLVLMAVFVRDIVEVAPRAWELSETDILLWLLSLIDMSLAANLLLMVVLAGYENFVSKMEVANHPDRPEWMGKIDFSGMKLKLIASIVAISAIYLLRAFMSVEKFSGERLMWLVIIHIVFVISGVLLAIMDYIAEKSHAVAHGHHEGSDH